MPYRAVMFDLDGTLADTIGVIAHCANHAFSQVGQPPRPVEDFRYLAGQGVRRLFVDAFDPTPDEAVIDRCIAAFQEAYARHADDMTKPFPGMLDTLTVLRQRGLKLAVLSNKNDGPTNHCVECVFAGHTFASVVGAKPDVPLKPDPTSALAITRALDIPPSDWLYVGDTRVDMETAKAAGMFAVGVLWGFRDEAELRASGADAIIDEPGQLLDLV